MKFLVGYRLMEDTSLIDCIISHKEEISEVYFSFGDFPNGRNNQMQSDLFTAPEAMEKQLSDLKILSDNGLRFNLLFNGNCYGKDSLSRSFISKIGDTTDFILRRFGLGSVTVSSPVFAKFFKNNFEDLEVRASVNMEIGTIEGMEYVSDVFDSFYVKREVNRNFFLLAKLKEWSDAHGKKLYGLANSGCLNNCSVHNYHDNLVAHETEISTMDNAYDFRGKCWDYLDSDNNKRFMVRNTNFIRPEDTQLYENYYQALKLATRASSFPCKIISAYTSGRYYGGINDLLEPNHSSIISPKFIDNSKFPKDFATIVGNCNKDCTRCSYCVDVYEKSLTEINNNVAVLDSSKHIGGN